MRIDYRVSTLANGLRVATVRNPGVDGLTLSLWVAAGGRFEPARLAGLSHFIEHLLFKGTARRSAREISRAVESRGGSLDAYTQEEATCYMARIMARHGPAALDVLADMVIGSRLRADDVEREREVIREEIALYRDQPQQHLEDLLMQALWPGHPLGHALTGTEASLAAITRADLLRFKQRHYRAGGMLLGAAGAVDHEPFVRQVERLWKALPVGRPPRWKRCVGGARRALVFDRRAIDQVHAAVGFRAFGRSDPRRYALRLLSILLGENMSSRLFQTVRERHGLAYSIGSSTQLFADTGFLSVEAGLDPARAARALALVSRELKRLRDAAPSAAELTRARDYALCQLVLGLENPGSQLGWVGEQLFYYNRVVAPDAIVRRIERVTRDEVRAVAEHLLQPRRMSVSLVVPTDADPVSLHAVFRRGLL